MKRNIYKVVTAGALSVMLMTSCEKKLDLYPYNSIELSQSFLTLNDARAWDNVMFAHLRARVYGLYQYSQDVQADQLNASLDFGNRNGNPHRWGQSFLADDYTIRDVWAGYYSSMKNVNSAIAGYPNVPVNSPAEQAQLDVYLGNAHLLRAYFYQELVLRWAKPYEPATAGTTPGVPLVLDYNPNAQPERSSVQAVYDQIITDIERAKTLLAGVTGTQGANRFTIDAVRALEARVRLNMHDFPGAKAAADAVIASNTYPLYTTEEGLKDMWHFDATRETIMQLFVSVPNEGANTNGLYLGYNAGIDKFVPDFIPSQWVIDMYEENDIRKDVYFEPKTVFIQGNTYEDIWLVNKYPGNPALFTGAATNYMHAPKVFRVAEMYLISAEAGARMGGAAEADALAKLNALRTSRGLDALAGLTGAALIDEVKEERFRELAFEGFRLFDLKRWKEGFARRDPQNTDIINLGTNYESLQVSADNNQFVWGLPTNDLTTNPNLAGSQNPGW